VPTDSTTSNLVIKSIIIILISSGGGLNKLIATNRELVSLTLYTILMSLEYVLVDKAALITRVYSVEVLLHTLAYKLILIIVCTLKDVRYQVLRYNKALFTLGVTII
jgi:hypothetical protein